jgi:hypothetical protein
MSNFLEALSGTLSLAAIAGGVLFIILPAFGGIVGRF